MPKYYVMVENTDYEGYVVEADTPEDAASSYRRGELVSEAADPQIGDDRLVFSVVEDEGDGPEPGEELYRETTSDELIKRWDLIRDLARTLSGLQIGNAHNAAMSGEVFALLARVEEMGIRID